MKKQLMVMTTTLCLLMAAGSGMAVRAMSSPDGMNGQDKNAQEKMGGDPMSSPMTGKKDKKKSKKHSKEMKGSGMAGAPMKGDSMKDEKMPEKPSKTMPNL